MLAPRLFLRAVRRAFRGRFLFSSSPVSSLLIRAVVHIERSVAPPVSERMRKSKNSGRLSLSAVNDNAVRNVRIDFPADFAVTEIELEIVETYLSAIIAELAAGPEFCSANDNSPVESE